MLDFVKLEVIWEL